MIVYICKERVQQTSYSNKIEATFGFQMFQCFLTIFNFTILSP